MQCSHILTSSAHCEKERERGREKKKCLMEGENQKRERGRREGDKAHHLPSEYKKRHEKMKKKERVSYDCFLKKTDASRTKKTGFYSCCLYFC